MSIKKGTPESGAVFSECESYRYALWRLWQPLISAGSVAFIGLNPSTADEHENDPTIRRLIGFAKQWGYGQMVMLNLFAYRATDPSDMMAQEDPVGPENDWWIEYFTKQSDLVVACWGFHGALKNRGVEVWNLLDSQPWCFGKTEKGEPKHPLYLKKDTELVTL